MTTEEYNDIPVFFCARCLSLAIKTDEYMGDYCPECGCTTIKEAHITEWQRLKKEREGLKL